MRKCRSDLGLFFAVLDSGLQVHEIFIYDGLFTGPE